MTHENHDDVALLRELMSNGGSGNTAQVTIRQDSLIAIAVGVICAAGVAVACTLCVAAVVVVAVMRDADVRDMAQIRGRLTNAEQFTAAHERRLNKLENPSDGE